MGSGIQWHCPIHPVTISTCKNISNCVCPCKNLPKLLNASDTELGSLHPYDTVHIHKFKAGVDMVNKWLM